MGPKTRLLCDRAAPGSSRGVASEAKKTTKKRKKTRTTRATRTTRLET